MRTYADCEAPALLLQWALWALWLPLAGLADKHAATSSPACCKHTLTCGMHNVRLLQAVHEEPCNGGPKGKSPAQASRLAAAPRRRAPCAWLLIGPLGRGSSCVTCLRPLDLLLDGRFPGGPNEAARVCQVWERTTQTH
jgi:hypothetical protein